VALRDAVGKLPEKMPMAKLISKSTVDPNGVTWPRYDSSLYEPKAALVDQLAAVSVGLVDGEVLLDLDYEDDSRAQVDMNVAYTAGGKFVEIQASAENGVGFSRAQMDEMLDMAAKGCLEIMERMKGAGEIRNPKSE
jgi:ribonuclease PH